MAEGLQTAGGNVLDVPPAEMPREFAAAMAAPEPTDPQVPAPPAKDPEAPYGRKADGSPKKGPGGRPPRAAKDPDKPRVQKATEAAAAAGEIRDFTQDLAELTDGMWLMMASFPVTQAQAAVLKANQAGLCHGFNVAAQHNRMIRRGVELLSGEGTWVMVVGMALAPFITTSWALWMAPERLEAAGMSRDDLAAATRGELKRMADQQAAAMRAAAGLDQAAAAAA